MSKKIGDYEALLEVRRFYYNLEKERGRKTGVSDKDIEVKKCLLNTYYLSDKDIDDMIYNIERRAMDNRKGNGILYKDLIKNLCERYSVSATEAKKAIQSAVKESLIDADIIGKYYSFSYNYLRTNRGTISFADMASTIGFLEKEPKSGVAKEAFAEALSHRFHVLEEEAEEAIETAVKRGFIYLKAGKYNYIRTRS
jgi:hypothetical protein